MQTSFLPQPFLNAARDFIPVVIAAEHGPLKIKPDGVTLMVCKTLSRIT